MDFSRDCLYSPGAFLALCIIEILVVHQRTISFAFYMSEQVS